MTPNEIGSLIGSVGFPIVVCIALFYFISKTMKEILQSINNNTNAINKLIGYIKGGKTEDD